MAFCPNCGASLEEGAKFCTSCGMSVVPDAQPQPEPQPAQYQPASPQSTPQQPPQSPSTPAGKNYEKLGGWLLFFVICYGISAVWSLVGLLGLSGVVGMMATHRGGLALPMICSALINVASIVADVFFIVLIVKKHPNFLRLLQIIRIAAIGASFLLTVIAGLSYGSGVAMFGIEAFSLLIGGAVGLILMTMYFCKSERVRMYMGSTEYLETALFKIGV